MCFNVTIDDEDCVIFESYGSLNAKYLKCAYNNSTLAQSNVTLDHKISHKGKMYTSSESWVKKDFHWWMVC